MYCDMTNKNGVGVTDISHDSESRSIVNGYDDHGSYSRDINYAGASLSWPVSPVSPHTASSLSSTSVKNQVSFFTPIQPDGGCHVILLR